MEQATLTIPAAADTVRAVLLDPLALPLWNEAFLAIDGPRVPAAGQAYVLRARPGMNGSLEYTAIEPDRVEMSWRVPGFHEVGSWTIATTGDVTHAFEHTGPLAAVLRRSYRGIAAVRLDRLANRVRQLTNP
ncbi:polyketide cyclase/dehydrase/lipid transport protein [Kribbella steppae]|uniref:Polyketide cyclase/dehydrase/lipid transport protein n=1 Tax=Kribbella steppae TaxID=2512223 RepID=A0A4R2H2Q1_9ACTN|nr:SRPBCC family protein [Kribbella steppae]TCO19270.1 polyketide cyclase/dehydrase/lipid transport protein [Kribbella steppae]